MTMPWEPSVLDQEPALDRLDNEVMNFEYFIAPTPAEVEARRWILQTIRKIFEEPYPGTKVVPFGSYKTGLALPNSDIDINIEIERSPNQTIKWLRRELVARGVCRQYDMETNRFKKGSVLKIFVPSKQVAADVTINNEIDSSMQTSQWIARYPKLKPLFLVLKHALSSIKYGNTNFQVMQSAFGGLAGYALICLIVHYLQLFDPNGNKLLSVLLMGFLKYYSELDLENQAITVGVEHMTTKDPKMQRKTLVVYENEQSTGKKEE
ncbi:hypothetical protein BC940DRAFT_313752 [Gongronella butleri]|nr:hypothetical protein BC940DRAFT_313752 [Gongronella butleri]